jgi:hypothetical protein
MTANHTLRQTCGVHPRVDKRVNDLKNRVAVRYR